MSYAIVATGGKQLKVAVGDSVKVEKLDVEVGKEVTLDKVLLVVDVSEPKIGTPFISSAKVIATVISQDKAKKIRVFKYKKRKKERKLKGHRQAYTELKIKEIIA